MIKIFQCIYGKKKQELMSMYIIEYLTVLLDSRLQKRCSQKKNPKVSCLKIFGCPVYVHIPKEKRTKKGIFIGYSEVSKAFKIYIPGFHHMEISRDVTFDEEAALKKSRKCQHEEVHGEDVTYVIYNPCVLC